ncbi:hypothetical protein CTZ28_43890 [Streptomyces shenzhenensis]|uniref:Uncharacterized protein n=1 Tax=Streptomyces shenzhenensis TaxID=943815 RepID=A0A3M0HRW6_9ACTN|nr:hypothetical protein CTZ28_43890 [Streptomyces shenzhenensis]
MTSIGLSGREPHGKGLQGGPRALPGRFQPVQVSNRADHVCGIGVLLAHGIDQLRVLVEFQEPVDSPRSRP